MKRLSILVVLGLLAVGFVWMFARDEPGRGGSTDLTHGIEAADAGRDAGALSAPRDIEAAAMPTRPIDSEWSVRRVPTPASELAAFEPSPAPEDGILVRVVAAETGAPVPNAIVFWWANGRMVSTDEALFESRGFDVDEIFESNGRRFRADKEGLVVVPRSVGDVTMLGRGHELRGLAALDSSEGEPFEFQLYPDPTLRVRVIDEKGDPAANVRVALRLRGDDDDAGSFDILRSTTDATGVAEIEHALSLLRMIGEAVVYAGVVAPLAAAVEKKLDPERLNELVELALPPHGSLAVRLEGPNGGAVPGEFPLSVEWDESDAEGPRDRSATFLIEDGVFEISPVALGLELQLAIGSLQGSEIATRTVRGPIRSGERVEQVFEIVPTTALSGRVLHPAGEPLTNAIVNLAIESHTGVQRRLRTDADGRFRFELGDRFGSFAGTLLVSTAVEGNADEFSALVPFAYGVSELGDIALELTPILASGWVVDRGGSGIVRATVRIESAVDDPSSGRAFRRWNESGVTDADGAFTIRGRTSTARLRVTARCPRYLSDEGQNVASIECARGTTELRIGLRLGGTVGVRVYVDQDVWDEELELVEELEMVAILRTTADASPAKREPTADLERTETTGESEGEIDGLAPGLYSVDVRSLAGEVLGSIENVVVRGGETSFAGELDLRGRLRYLSLNVVDSMGEAIEATARCPSDDRVWLTDYARSRGSIAIVTVDPVLNLVVEAHAYRPAELDNVQGGETVVLHHGFPVTLRIVGGMPSALRENETLTVRLAPESSEPNDVSGRFGADATVELVALEPGPHRVHLQLWTVDEKGHWSAGQLDGAGFARVLVEEHREMLVDLNVTNAMCVAARDAALGPTDRR